MTPEDGAGKVSPAGGSGSSPWRGVRHVLLWLLVLPLLYLFYWRNPSSSHDVAETFSVIVSVGTFMLTWNARRFLDNHYFLFIGIAYLFVGILDLVHAHAFEGAFAEDGPNRLAQLWVAARYVQSAALLLAPLFVVRKVRAGPVFGGFAAAAAALLIAIFGGIFPDCVGRPGGPTGFKIGSDCAISGLGAAAVWALWRVRSRFDLDVYRLLVRSILFLIATEMASAVYVDAFVYNNLVAHYFKVISFYLVYKAVIETGLLRPYDLLFRNLKASEGEVTAARNALEARVAEQTAELRAANARLEDDLAGRRRAEEMRELVLDLLGVINSARTVREFLASVTGFLKARFGFEAVGIRYREGDDYPYSETLGFSDDFVRAESVLHSPGRNADGTEPVGGERFHECACGAVIDGRFDPSLPCLTPGGTFWTNGAAELVATSETVRGIATRARCIREGFESIALVPLRLGGQTFGLIQLNDRRKGMFAPHVLARLERVAEHVSGALARFLAQEALRESENRFRSLVEKSSVGILIVHEGRVVFRNPGHERLFGASPVGTRFREIGWIHPEDSPKFERLCEALEGNGPVRAEMDLRFFLAAGESGHRASRWVHCRASAIDFRGRPSALVDMVDITRQKDLEQIVTIREKLASIGQMAAGIAHEIRNPLSGININVSTLEHLIRNLDGVPPEEKERVAAIVAQARSASDKMASVIRRVMEFSKPVPPRLDRVDANQSVREAIEFASATLRNGGIAVDLSLAPDLPRCPADPRLLEQVLLNLISNAVQALESVDGERRIGVSTALEDRSVVVRISDSGPGVPVHLREKIFDPFYTTRKDGHGIGLAFSQRVISDHGGTLSVGESVRGGAEFRVELPIEPAGRAA